MTFKDFWTNENNPKLPKAEYMYGTRHLIVLLIVVMASVLLSIYFSQKSQKAKQRLLYSLASVLLFFEITSRIVDFFITPNIDFGMVLKILLPMEMCSVVVWVFIIAIFTKKRVLYEFSAIVGLFATLAFLLFPAVGLNRTYMSFTCIYSTVSHMVGFVCAILIMTLGFVKFELKKIWQVYLCYAIMFAWGVLLDLVIFPGSNYMYVLEDPLELNMKFPYQVLYLAIIAIYTLAFYLIPYLKQKFEKKSKAKQISAKTP